MAASDDAGMAPSWPDGLEAVLASSPVASYAAASRAWAGLQPSPLDAPHDKHSVLTHPCAWLTIGLQSAKPTVGRVFKELVSSGVLEQCLPIIRAALGPVADHPQQAVPPPTMPMSVKLLLKYCVQQASTGGDGAATRVARCIVCALSRRLTLDGLRSSAVLELLSHGLTLQAKKRTGLVFLHPLRRLSLLAGAQELIRPGQACPDALRRCLELVAATDTGAREFVPLTPRVVEDLLHGACSNVTSNARVDTEHTESAGAAETMPRRPPTLLPPASLASLLRAHLEPLTAAPATSGRPPEPYQWESPPDEYLVSSAMHRALERALGDPSGVSHADDSLAELHRAAAGDACELLCAAVSLMYYALEPSQPHGAERSDAAVHLLCALLGSSPPSAMRGASATRSTVALPAAMWCACIDTLLASSLEQIGVCDVAARRKLDRVLLPPLPCERAEAAAIDRWWPTVLAELRTRDAYSSALDALMRRTGRISCSRILSSEVARTTKRAKTVDSSGAPPSRSDLRLTISDARALVSISLFYLPAALPLLSAYDARHLLHELALSSVPTAATGRPAEGAPSKQPPTEPLLHALHGASRHGPPAVRSAFALLRLWYANPSPTSSCLGEEATAEALESAGADLALCAHSADLLREIYLPPPGRATLVQRRERAELLLVLLEEWAERGVYEVGPTAAARAVMLGCLGESALPKALAAVKAEAEQQHETLPAELLESLEATRERIVSQIVARKPN